MTMRGWLVLFVLLCTLGVCRASAPLPACGSLPEGAEVLLKAGKIVLVGEVHGTTELPGALATLACQAAQRRLSVTVGYELPSSENPRLEAYLRSAGTANDRRVLLSGPAWRRRVQDGTTSRGVFELIEFGRRLRGAGAKITIVGLESPGDKDRMMAENLVRAQNERPTDFLIAAGGMNHMWKLAGDLTGAGYYLQEGGVPATALRMTASGGTQYQCSGGKCIYPYPDPPVQGGPTQRVRLYGQVRDGFDGELYLGPVTASAPAAEPPPGGWQMM
jgi:hypothetical protein